MGKEVKFHDMPVSVTGWLRFLLRSQNSDSFGTSGPTQSTCSKNQTVSFVIELENNISSVHQRLVSERLIPNSNTNVYVKLKCIMNDKHEINLYSLPSGTSCIKKTKQVLAY